MTVGSAVIAAVGRSLARNGGVSVSNLAALRSVLFRPLSIMAQAVACDAWPRRPNRYGGTFPTFDIS